MSQINWGILQNALAQPDPGQRFQAGFDQGRARREAEEQKNALSTLFANPGDQGALAAYGRADPKGALQYQQTQAQIAATQQKSAREVLESRREDIKIGGQIFRQMQPKDDAGYQAALQMFQRMGGNLADVPTTYDPSYVDGIIATANALDPIKPESAPANVQEYQFAQRQGYKGSYTQFLDMKGGPFQFDINGDGAPDLVPREHYRSMVSGQPTPQTQTQTQVPVTVSTPDEARSLPPGTEFRTPDGRIMRVPGGGAGPGQQGFPG